MCSSGFLRATEHSAQHTDFTWQSSCWWKLLRILFPAIQWIICPWIWRDKGIHVWWDEGQIMKVIHQKKQPKSSRFYLLVSFTKPHEKSWKRKHSSNGFVSQHFFTWGWDQKSLGFCLQSEEESEFLHAVVKQAGQTFQSYLWRKQIFVIFNDCQAAKICFKILLKSLVNHFQATHFSIWDWQTLKLVLFYNLGSVSPGTQVPFPTPTCSRPTSMPTGVRDC